MALSVEAIRRIVDEARWANGRVAEYPRTVREELLGRALGRVLAHEIGHYLLVWPSHTSGGLMRSAFQGHALIERKRHTFGLSDTLMPRLRARLALLATPDSSVAEAR